MPTDRDEAEGAQHVEHDEGATRGERRRRPRIPPTVLAFAGVLCAGVLIGWVIFRDDESAPASDTPTVAGQRVGADARMYPKLGITLDLPKGWKTSFRRSVLTAVSRDETMSVALSAAGGADDGQRVRRSDRTQLARLFKANELSRHRAKVGTETTIVTELVGRARNRRPIRILSMGTSSRWRTYSIQAFTVLRPTARRIAELRTLLASVRYRQPR
ncbi:MAG TPA: hypothetical protein VGV90_03740 [Solirubrobacteraceae bacterium]|nr:hypothetical protein [Solirubrobacteraceae bacterium]